MRGGSWLQTEVATARMHPHYLAGAESPFILSELAGEGAAGLELVSVPLPAPCEPGAILFDGAGAASPVVPFVAESAFIAGSAALAASPAFDASSGAFCAPAPIGSKQTTAIMTRGDTPTP
jgi:hypothetical protein